MRTLILSDIHANLTALNTVLDSAGDVDQVWCLGDVVGYGPDPNECIQRLRSLPALVCILGNHDAAVSGRIQLDSFNPEARFSILWTRSAIGPENLAWLEQRPERLVVEDITLVHGSPRNPVWEYILDPATAALAFDHYETELCFVGHTHLPIVYTLSAKGRPARWYIPTPGEKHTLSVKAIINPGSTGQPRDRDPRAAYGIFDTQDRTWEPRRIAYNFREVQERMRSLQLPIRLSARLAEGW